MAPSKPEFRQLLANHHTQQPQHQPKPGSKTSGLRPFTDPVTKVSDAKERHGGCRWYRGRLFPGGFGTCQKGSSNPTGRDTDQRLRTISGESSSTSGHNRCPESYGGGQYRGGFQEIGIFEGSPAEQAAASSRKLLQKCRGCRHWWPSCSPNLCRLLVQHQWHWTFPVPSAVDCEKITCLLVWQAGGGGKISQLIIQGAQEWHGVQAEQTTVGSGPGMLPSTVGLMVR